MSEPNHHFVPQVYLRQFNEGNGIIVYDVESRKTVDLLRQIDDPIIVPNPKGIASAPNYYTRETPDGPDYSFEDELSKIENLYPAAIKAVRMRQDLTEAQWGIIVGLAAVQDARVHRMALVEPMRKLEESARALYRAHNPHWTEEQIEASLTEMMRREIIDHPMPTPENISLEAIKIGMKFSLDVFRHMYPCIVYSEAQHFITSDKPVVWCDPSQFPETGQIFNLSGYMEVTFPLTRKACLVLSWTPIRKMVTDGDEALVATINARTAGYANRYLYAASTNSVEDRVLHWRDFSAVDPSIPISLHLADDTVELSDENARDYVRCLEILGIPWETAREHNRRFAVRYKAAAGRYLSQIQEPHEQM